MRKLKVSEWILISIATLFLLMFFFGTKNISNNKVDFTGNYLFGINMWYYTGLIIILALLGLYFANKEEKEEKMLEVAQ